MKVSRRVTLVGLLSILIAGCATVRQVDLDAWKGVPVEALDTHSFFLTLPVFRTVTESGIEVRNYSNSAEISSCFGGVNAGQQQGFVNASTFARCTSQKIACNNIFYIRDGKVMEYAPTGRCMTNETVQPESRYRALIDR